jgi:hypothetical protein
MPKIATITREQWLQQAVSALKLIFSAKGYVVPNCHVFCGFTSTDVKRGHIGQCWSTKASADKVNQIFISLTCPGDQTPLSKRIGIRHACPCVPLAISNKPFKLPVISTVSTYTE